LFNFAFCRDLYGFYKEHLCHNRNYLALRIDMRSCPELVDLPWEMMHDGVSFLFLSSSLILTRCLNDAPCTPARIVGSPRVLVLISDPFTKDDHAPLDVDRELQIFVSSVQGLGASHIEFLHAPTLDHFSAVLRMSAFNVLHYIGHAKYDRARREGALLFQSKDGSAEAVTAARFVNAINQARQPFPLVFLNACETATTSVADVDSGFAWQLVANGIPAVVAMRTVIPDDTAAQFARNFYRTLFEGRSVADSVDVGRKAIAGDIAAPDLVFCAPVLVQQTPSELRFEAATETSLVFAEAEDVPKMIRTAEINCLEKRTKENEGRPVFLVGLPGTGKSTVIEALRDRLVLEGSIDRYVRWKGENFDSQSLANPLVGPRCLFHLEYSGPVPPQHLQWYANLRSRHLLVVEGCPGCSWYDFSSVHFLAPIPLSESIRLCQTFLRGADRLTLAFKIAKLTEGNPRLMTTVLASAFESEDPDQAILGPLISEALPIRDQIRGWVPAQQEIYGLLCVLLEPLQLDSFDQSEICRDLGLDQEAGRECLRCFLLEGWIVPHRPGASAYIVPGWIREALKGLWSGQGLTRSHWVAARYCESIHSPNTAYHYEQAGENVLAFAHRMGRLDDLMMIDTVNALGECHHLIERIPAGLGTGQFLARAQIVSIMALGWKRLGQDARSEEALEQLPLLLSEAPPDVPPVTRMQLNKLAADSYLERAWYAFEGGRQEESEKLNRLALEIYQESGSGPGEILRSHLLSAWISLKKGDEERFCEMIHKASTMAEEIKDLRALCDVQMAQGIFEYRTRKNVQAAIHHFSVALSLAEGSGDSRSVGFASQYLGEALGESETQADAGIEVLQRARQIYEMRGEEDAVARTRIQAARLYLKYADLPEATKEFIASRRLYREAKNESEFHRCQEALASLLPALEQAGDTYWKNGKRAEAFKYFDAQEEAANALNEISARDRAIFKLGIIAYEFGEYDVSIRRLTQCRASALQREDLRLAAEALHEIGCAQMEEGHFQDAKESFKQALAEKRALGLDAPEATHMLATIHIVEADYASAYPLLKDCIERDAKQKGSGDSAASLLQFADLLFRMERLEEAESKALEAKQLFDRFQMFARIVRSLQLLSWIQYRRGKPQLALDSLREALNLCQLHDLAESAEIQAELSTLRNERGESPEPNRSGPLT